MTLGHWCVVLSQSFSSVGRAQDKFSMAKDKRNYFYKDFFECLKIIKPNFFVFENVRPSAQPDAGSYAEPTWNPLGTHSGAQ